MELRRASDRRILRRITIMLALIGALVVGVVIAFAVIACRELRSIEG